MKMILLAVFLIGGPMAVTELIYRLVDHKGKKTARLVEKFPVLKEKKFLIQIGGSLGFVLVFGALCWLLNWLIPFFVVSGIVLGLINGMAVTIMYND